MVFVVGRVFVREVEELEMGEEEGERWKENSRRRSWRGSNIVIFFFFFFFFLGLARKVSKSARGR